jgi:cytochrome c oxidase subunit 3
LLPLRTALNLQFAFAIFNFQFPLCLKNSNNPRGASSALQHHFENMEQQREAGTLGMWVFLVTEIMFFGGMFLAYTLYRAQYPAAFVSASNHLDITLGAVNTGVLIVSSFTMAMAVWSTQVGRNRITIICLILTMILGATFLGIKASSTRPNTMTN